MERKKALRNKPKRRRRRSLLPILIVGGAAIAAVLAFILLTSGGEGGGGPAIIPTPGSTRVAAQTGTVLGEETAPVTVVEYFSFTCPHCGNFALHTAPLIEKDYVETGRVKFELHALAAKGPSLDAAAGALCAADQGRYWDYHDVLFANYDAAGSDAYAADRLKEYAAGLGLDAASFNACLDSGQYETAVLDDTKRVVDVGITATPNFFIGLTKDMKDSAPPFPGARNIVGAQQYDVFKVAIEDALGKVP
ncbi:MAG: thioredoxin domain-containing protein [Dehalococcoidia bacterium]|nr:thioredoxin domain-containing protein [Dehalococcoidia bacterium]